MPFGRDTVLDFTAGDGSDDVIEFESSIFSDFNAVLAAAVEVDGNIVISVDADNQLILTNVALSSLNADDFRFVA